MNHDSSAGTAQWIQEVAIPVLPTWRAGWHTRSKARHFTHYAALATELGGIIGVDPWFLSPLGVRLNDVDINEDASRSRIAAHAETLLKAIQAKYNEYQIGEKPFIFLKSDHGTYGMAMLSFDNAAEILEINRKEKNKLFKGKSSVVVKDYLLQEGIPTILKDAVPGGKIAYTAESVIMLANNRFIGKFLRVNEQKDTRQSLNSTGMFFKPVTLE
ncbi:MAG TPA: glutamate--cysteine ligase, partial [Turneriella sp.]|nr:glutamate--cysteine ligase [Turneriella sp.]